MNISKSIWTIAMILLMFAMSSPIYSQDLTNNPDAADLNLENCKIPVFATDNGTLTMSLGAAGRLEAVSREGGTGVPVGNLDFVRIRTCNTQTGGSTDYPIMYLSSLRLSSEQRYGQQSIKKGELVGCATDQKIKIPFFFLSKEQTCKKSGD